MTAKLSKDFGNTIPKTFSWQNFLENSKFPRMVNKRSDSNDAVAERLRLLRQVVSGENQTAFAARLGIEVKRWNNFERSSPLSKEVAFLIVRKFPNVTLDWLWLGIPDGLPVRFQRELTEAGNATTSAPATAGRSRGKTSG